MNEDGTWLSDYDGERYPTKEDAMRSVEEYHLRELAKYFDLEEEVLPSGILLHEV